MIEELLKEIKAIYPRFVPPPCQLVGQDGNAFAVIGFANRALRQAGYPLLVPLYQEKATAGDYINLLAVTSIFTEVR